VTWGQTARALKLKGDTGGTYRLLRETAARLELDTSHFLGAQWNKGNGAGRDPLKQRAAKKRWYDDNRQVYRDRNKRQHAEKRRRLNALKRVPCADCRIRYPSFVMEFDHRDGDEKLGNISGAVLYWSWARIMAEVAKCDVVCANCHRIRTARRAGWSEYLDDDDSGWGDGDPSRILTPALAGSSPAPEATP
jgi:hypothetical protein